MKLSAAQQKMINRLRAGTHIIGYRRNWYCVRDGQHIFMGSKAHNETIEALLTRGVLIEEGTIDQVGYCVKVVQ